jgi:hypothetical protein
MSPRLALSGSISSPAQTTRALEMLGARDRRSAHDLAVREVRRAPRCFCCVSQRAHLAIHVGSTLFLDDDPFQLQQAVPIEERAFVTPQLIAALIVLHGRARVDPFGKA